MLEDTIHKGFELPREIPVLPVRNTVVFPNAAIPLVVGRPKSVAAINHAKLNNNILVVVSQKDGSKENPNHSDLHRMGVVCVISKIVSLENDGFQLIANGLFRFQVDRFIDHPSYLLAVGQQKVESIPSNPARIEAIMEEVKSLGKNIIKLSAIPGSESLEKLLDQTDDATQIADFCCTFLGIAVPDKQELLELLDLEKRLSILHDLMVSEVEKATVKSELQTKMMERLSKDQRNLLLREQLRTIHEELGEEGNTAETYRRKIEASGMPEEGKKVAREEIGRIASIPRSSPEYHVITTYLDWLLALPWKKTSAKTAHDISLEQAKKVLDKDHFGLEKVKKRIIQFLAVNKLKNDIRGPILCLVGPPGVGKTSIGRSIATALGRQFTQASLGGLRDEAEIRGHRRTYIGALPGRIVQSYKRVGVKDPLFMLDEIDKVGTDFRGDPASALLEVLDPEQNHSFMDHYIDVPFDLSRTFFITTANVIETIPAALKDRLEIIEMTSYSRAEKKEIAVRHLMHKLLHDHGIKAEQIHLPVESIDRVIEDYTQEAGVRELTRQISQLLRAAAEALASEHPVDKFDISPDKIESILGPQKYFPEIIDDKGKPGVVTGLAWTSVGGKILTIEVAKFEGSGNLILTGQLGDVMKESARIALSLVRSMLSDQVSQKFDKIDFHIHVPSGSIPKDGPSAGVAIYLAFASLLKGQAVDPNIAVTGEITLQGWVLPVGGVKEKILAAHRAGIKEVYLPHRNEGDLLDVSKEVKKQLKFHFMKDISDCLSLETKPVKAKKQPALPTIEGHA